MSFQITDPVTQLCREMEALIEAAIEGASAQVTGSGGHFEITVTSAAFEGQSRVNQQRMVYGPITALMSGPDAPVHAIDRMNLKTS
jgi:acid stress-induced BolA-like protein IbaG/YrbA